MNKITKTVLILFLLLVSVVFLKLKQRSDSYGAPPAESDQVLGQSNSAPINDYSNWKRPDGPIRIGIQVGHWKMEEMPDEQAKLRDTGGGATSDQGTAEWEVNLGIAQETKKLLENEGYIVDLLPATIPESYWADAFVSIHADGNLSPLVSGYKVAAYRRDRTGKAAALSKAIEKSYGEKTKFELDPNISTNMTSYYAFNIRKYKHAIHPMTPGVIVETGFLTNPNNAFVLINNPRTPAQGIANGIIEYIQSNSN